MWCRRGTWCRRGAAWASGAAARARRARPTATTASAASARSAACAPTATPPRCPAACGTCARTRPALHTTTTNVNLGNIPCAIGFKSCYITIYFYTVTIIFHSFLFKCSYPFKNIKKLFLLVLLFL